MLKLPESGTVMLYKSALSNCNFSARLFSTLTEKVFASDGFSFAYALISIVPSPDSLVTVKVFSAELYAIPSGTESTLNTISRFMGSLSCPIAIGSYL